MKTKEEILKKKVKRTYGYIQKDIYEAMEEYAAQFQTPEQQTPPVAKNFCDAMGHYGAGYPDGLCPKCNKPYNLNAPPVAIDKGSDEEEDEPYFGWCDVEGCENESCNNGSAWRESGYWKVCTKHAAQHREGLPQPKMKQKSVDRENSRGEDGRLPTPPQPPIENKEVEQSAKDAYKEAVKMYPKETFASEIKRESFVDGWNAKPDAAKESVEFSNVLEKAVQVIKDWHEADDVWDIYYNNAPEMKQIREWQFKNKTV